MIGIVALIILGTALAGSAFGVARLIRAFRSPGHRVGNALLSLFGFGIAGLLTYPIILGPAVAAVACGSAVGLHDSEKVDLSATGYEVNWPTGIVQLQSGALVFSDKPEAALFRRSLDDVIARRAAFIETASLESGGLHRISLGPATSRQCVEYESESGDTLPFPPGTCLQIESVSERQSHYLLETSASYGRKNSFERSIEFIERASGRVVASYVARRIANAKFEIDGDGARRCPVDADHPDSPLFALAAHVADPDKRAPLAFATPAVAGESRAPACELPRLPASVEVHRYYSNTGRSPTTIQIDNSGQTARENVVSVNRPGIPVVLRLSSYDPVVWRVRQTKETEILAVVVDSDNGAAVTGVSDDTAVLISTARYSRMANCSKRELLEIDAKLRTFQTRAQVNGGGRSGSGQDVIPFFVGPAARDEEYTENPAAIESRYAFAGGVPSGADGVAYLVSTGAARLLTPQDATALLERPLPMAEGPAGQKEAAGLMAGNSVILLRQTALPDGMYGGLQRLIIVPRGVPAPLPPLGHNRILRVDAACEVSPCRY